MSLFVDTSAWYAAADRGDTSHGRAVAVLSAGEPLVTTDHVLVETWFLVRHRLGGTAAERFWAGMRGGAARVELVREVDLEAAWRRCTLAWTLTPPTSATGPLGGGAATTGRVSLSVRWPAASESN